MYPSKNVCGLFLVAITFGASNADAQTPSPPAAGRTFDQVIQDNDRWLRNESPTPSSQSSSSMLNEILLTVSLVVQRKSGGDIGFATGFFYNRGDEIFLVTNQHVFLDEKAVDGDGKPRPIVPDTLRLKLHTDANDVRKVGDLDVPIYNGKEKLWKTSKQSPTADVALIKLDPARLKNKFVVKAWSKETFLPADLVLSPGEDVFIMGYPLGVHDTVHNLPIFRNAMLASTYRVPFQGNQCFLTDANIHAGLSGSPIITKPKSAWPDTKGNVRMVTGVPYYLVGVNSAYLNIRDPNKREIGLGVGWYAELIEDIASAF